MDRVNRATAVTEQTQHITRRKGETERILVVDDADGVREIISHILTTAGYDCRTVSSGRDALALLKSGERFDLMLCDLLNNPHGISLLDRTKKEYPAMPVIIVTAPCCLCTARFAVNKMGASGYLVKPFHAKALLTAIWRTRAGRHISDATSGEA